MRKITSILSFLCIILYVSCSTKPAPPPIIGGESSEEQQPRREEQKKGETILGGKYTPNPISEEQESPIDNKLQRIYDIWSYSPQTISIPAQTTIDQAIYSQYPSMRKCYDFDNVGGIKLIGEMSADRAGYNYSYYSYPISLNILSLSQLHLGFISSCNNVVCLVVDGKVVIESAKIVSGTIGMGMGIDINVNNQTQSYQEVEFTQGQMVEVKEPHVQNVLIASTATAQLPPKKTWHFTLPVFCAAHHRTSPTGFEARITPYVMNAPATTYQSQQDVWKVLESNEDPNSYVTFYVWGKGDATGSGRSLTGHAFVRIPQVGVIGFSSLHGGILNDDGRIYDHTTNIKYATDSCRIKVSEEAKKLMIKKLHQLQLNVPKYKIGRYDCTSFVMDLADAGGIHYGSRISIQTPVGFMQELKKHNYSY